ncbi:TrmB family transcriptional regulator sugar-binding domain-containing protein [Streptomyces spectabilis]|uniref:TrmB family transcriptional regulator sugar-binding domain-containing protein n=1 Tax=Streptomyces spectabilis TaxID=68270 RepID=UPI0033F3CCE2
MEVVSDGWSVGESLALTPEEVQAYGTIAAGGIPEGVESVRRLVGLGLVAPAVNGEVPYVALDPRRVAERVRDTERVTMARSVGRLNSVGDIENLADVFDQHRFYGGLGTELLGSKDLVNARIGPVLEQARKELCTAQPGQPEERDPEGLKIGMERARRAIDRGVRMRWIYNEAVRSYAPMREYIEGVIEAGGEVRLHSVKFPRMVIVDRRNAFIDNRAVIGLSPDAGVFVDDFNIAAWLHDEMFADLWERSERWQDAASASEQTVTNKRQRSILKELDAGCPQNRVGERLGLGERVVNRELADLRKKLGLLSTYQLMSWWGRSAERFL